MIAACVFPGCNGGADKQPVLTALGTCDDCRPRFRRLITEIVLDYVNLKRNLPRPAARSMSGRGSPSKAGYGHPAEWASDMAADIKTTLFWLADDLADHLEAEHQMWLHGDEAAVVRVAHRFLTANFVAFAGSPLAEHAALEIQDLHRTIRQGMGHTQMGTRLPAPCPECDVAALIQRSPARPRIRKPSAREVRQDTPAIRCANCGHEIQPGEYGAAVAAKIQDGAAARAAAIDALLELYRAGVGPMCAQHLAQPLRCRSTSHAGQAAQPLEPQRAHAHAS